MAQQTITLQLPEMIYKRLADLAQARARSVEAETVRVLQEAVTWPDGLPRGLEERLAQLALLTDEELWQAAQTEASPEDNERVQALLEMRQREGLTVEQEAALVGMTRYLNQIMLVRGKAAALLNGRGHDASRLAGLG